MSLTLFCFTSTKEDLKEFSNWENLNFLDEKNVKFISTLQKGLLIDGIASIVDIDKEQYYLFKTTMCCTIIAHDIPILKSFKSCLNIHLTKTPVQSKIGETIRYTLSNWDFLNNYFLDGKIEINNNLLENAIRPFALGRKNWLFKGSPAGANAGAIFYSLIETCKANNIEPYKYFCKMLHHIRECLTEADYEKLLPQFIEI